MTGLAIVRLQLGPVAPTPLRLPAADGEPTDELVVDGGWRGCYKLDLILVPVWTVRMVEEVEHWFNALSPADRALASAAIDLLRDRGPLLGRPLVDRITGSKLHNLKELRPGSTGTRCPW